MLVRCGSPISKLCAMGLLRVDSGDYLFGLLQFVEGVHDFTGHAEVSFVEM
jgi:hypothetical protein